MLVRIIFLLSLIATTVSCATSNYSSGKDFNADSIDKIERGVTTTEQLQEWLGEPYSKYVVSDMEERWIYMYTSGTAKATSGIFTMKMESTGTHKTLDVLIKGGIVVNYAFTKGDSPYNYNVQ